jgi:SAM-dependent methyltransferase
MDQRPHLPFNPASQSRLAIEARHRQHSNGNISIVGLYKYLLIPQLIWYGVRSPRDQALAWDRFWASIQRTGADGEVIWDAASTEELDRVRAHALEHMARDLPIVDIGCGNGRFSRLLAGSFPKVLGIDISAHAVRRAEEESGEADNVTYRVLDASAAGAGQRLFEELGEANVSCVACSTSSTSGSASERWRTSAT